MASLEKDSLALSLCAGGASCVQAVGVLDTRGAARLLRGGTDPFEDDRFSPAPVVCETQLSWCFGVSRAVNGLLTTTINLPKKTNRYPCNNTVITLHQSKISFSMVRVHSVVYALRSNSPFPREGRQIMSSVKSNLRGRHCSYE